MVGILERLGCHNDSLLIATEDYDANVYKSARNITDVSVSPARELNAYSVLAAKRLLVTTEVLDALKAKAAGNGSKAAAAETASDE